MLRYAVLVGLCLAYGQCVLLKTLDLEEWNLFKMQHNKLYTSEREEYFRKKIYQENKYKIIKHNQEFAEGKHTYNLAMNEFGDLLHTEFRKTMNGFLSKYNNSKALGNSTFYIKPVHVNAPAEKDWREHGAVTPVKNQGRCGSCWSFSTTGSLEGQHFRKTGKLVSLSEQNLIDCSTSYGNDGCNGGLMDQAFQYVKDNGGIDTELSYPYRAEDETCEFKRRDIGATDTGFVDIPSGSEDDLKVALANIGPISVAIDASHPSFQFYKNGIYDEPSCDSYALDHGVLAVGYGTSSDGDFWIVKNSWGPSWGDNGYVRMSRNKHNQCGIATKASYPLV